MLAPMAWDDGLEGAYREIAGCSDPILRVLAGPGTGKTFALMRRVARLLEEGIDGRRLLAVTFTRTAAHDLIRQLQRIEARGALRVWAGTLHALCFRTLGQSGVFDLTGRVPRPLLDFEVRFLLADLPDIFGRQRAKERRLKAFEAAWAMLQTDAPGWPQDPTDRAFHQHLIPWLTFHRGMLIGELVPVTLEYLRNNPTARLRASFSHILVDEYQDLNKAEQVLIDLIAANGCLVVAGDDDQSVYRFKFAHPEGIIEFVESHSGTRCETLDECRRCPRFVIGLANNLIANNPRATPRVLRPRSSNPDGEVHVVQWRTLDEETSGIAEFVRRRIEQGRCEAGSVLVLAPRRRLGYRIRDYLREMQVPARSYFFEEALESVVAQERYTLLNLLVDSNDRVAMRCWLGFGSTTRRQGPYRRLREVCEESGLSPREVLMQLAHGSTALPYSGEMVERYRLLMDERATLSELIGSDFVWAWLPDSLDGVDELRDTALRVADQANSLAELREEIRYAITQPELPTEADFVRIMSLHKSKGLTADMVVIVGCVEGLIPWRDNRLSPDELNEQVREQRRLFYVAVTRTSDVLVISGSATYPVDEAYRMLLPVRPGGRSTQVVASEFINELGPQLPAPVNGRQWLQSMSG